MARHWQKLQKQYRITRIITKTYPYNFDPLKPHLYTVKLGFTGVYIIFLMSAHNLCFDPKNIKFFT